MTSLPDFDEVYLGDAYRGPATLLLGQASFEVTVDLRGRFEPIDGRYHWYGRAARSDALTAAMAQGRATGTLRTPAGTAECELSDPDSWGRFRIAGISTPPFRSQLTVTVSAPESSPDEPESGA